MKVGNDFRTCCGLKSGAFLPEPGYSFAITSIKRYTSKNLTVRASNKLIARGNGDNLPMRYFLSQSIDEQTLPQFKLNSNLSKQKIKNSFNP
jgi:hypothetical protein